MFIDPSASILFKILHNTICFLCCFFIRFAIPAFMVDYHHQQQLVDNAKYREMRKAVLPAIHFIPAEEHAKQT